MFLELFDVLQILSYLIVLLLLVPLIGMLWSLLVQGKRTLFHPFFSWLETLSYRFAGIDPNEEMNWIEYAKNLIIFNVCGGVVLFLMLIFQFYLPLNPQSFSGVSFEQAFNIATSFVTNTNWQSYAGETTLSYTSQMVGLTVQNFLSAATGSAVGMAMVRGIVQKQSETIGNFWADLVRSVVYLFLPLSIIVALVLVGQGVIQTLSPYEQVETLESGIQTIPLGPVASQEAIKIIGTNGGGFFNANSAHPYENPNTLTNFIQMIFLVAVPAGIVYAYGLLAGSKKHALLLLTVMFVFWLVGFGAAWFGENQHNLVLEAFPLWEGKEVRLGNLNSILWSTMTTATSNGAVNMMQGSLSPIAGGVALFNMLLGEEVFGGAGVGLGMMIIFVLLTVFVCGLMVGRTPEYMGKKLDRVDIQWVVLVVLAPTVLILLGAGISSVLPIAQSSLSTTGPHGLTELLYAFTSAVVNNGSAFAGLNANTPYYNLLLGVLMVLGRLAILIPCLGVAGSFAGKKSTPRTVGSLSTNGFLFGALLLGVIFIFGGLSFLPALSLGPIVEQLMMMHGQSFPITMGV
jgi:K+-transporting ATPase ATPase A chain